jgi:hypothetical protein
VHDGMDSKSRARVIHSVSRHAQHDLLTTRGKR